MKDELNKNTGKVETINKNPAAISDEDLSMVVGGLQDRGIDWSVENGSVPITDDDPCPRCHQHMIKLQMGPPDNPKPMYYVCLDPLCKYIYTPPEWKI